MRFFRIARSQGAHRTDGCASPIAFPLKYTRDRMIDRGNFQRFPDIAGDDDEDTALLREMAQEARRYIAGHTWCPPEKNLWLACGVGGVVALFLVEFSQKIAGSPDDTLWLVVGDLPSAYFVTENATTPRDALECYCNMMEEWITAVLDGGDLEEVYPVEAEPNEQNAQELESRLEFLRAEIIPAIT